MSLPIIDTKIDNVINNFEASGFIFDITGRELIHDILLNYYNIVMRDNTNELSKYNKSSLDETFSNIMNLIIMDIYMEQNKGSIPIHGDTLRHVLYWTQFGPILPSKNLDIYKTIYTDDNLSDLYVSPDEFSEGNASQSQLPYNTNSNINNDPYLTLNLNYERVDIRHVLAYMAPIPINDEIPLEEYKKFIQLFWNSIQLPLIDDEYPPRPNIHPDVLTILGEYLQKEDAMLFPLNSIYQLGISFNLNCKPNGWNLEDTYTVDSNGKNEVPKTTIEARTNFLNVILITFIGKSFFECINHRKNFRLMNMYRSIAGITNPPNFDKNILKSKPTVRPLDFELPPLVFLANLKIIPKNYYIKNPLIDELIINLINRKFPRLTLGESDASIAMSIHNILQWFNYMFDLQNYKNMNYKPLNTMYVEYAGDLGLDSKHNITVQQLEENKRKFILSRVEAKLRFKLIPVAIDKIDSHNIDQLYEYKDINIENNMTIDPEWINWVEGLSPKINALLVNLVNVLFSNQSGEITFLRYMTLFKSSPFSSYYTAMYDIQ